MSVHSRPVAGDLTATRPAALARRATVAAGAGYLGLALVVLIFGIPLYWMASASLKTLQEIFTFPPIWLPRSLYWQNYVAAWEAAPFGTFFFNSLFVTSSIVLLKLINATLTAYALVFLRVPGKNIIFLILLAALMVPEQALILSNYLTASSFGWVNTYAGLILPHGGVVFGTFLLRQHFLTLPKDILEAAQIEGAGHRHVIQHIVLPLSAPVLATVALLAAVSSWNEFLWPLIITNSKEMRTLPIGLAFLSQQEGTTQWGIVMAATMFVVVPILIFFLWAQRHLVAGLTAGATKG
ncbi:MAG: carbohydrate ABC transporter permease [Chloroflexi bacterium]|nr:carbohydrate ABC transporter permease [Chloroflexota bacterium]